MMVRESQSPGRHFFMEGSMKKISLRTRLIRLFAATSIIPVLIFGIYSYYNIAGALRDNTEIITNSNLRQVDQNLNVWLDSYEDLLYQIYTEDNMAAWTGRLDQGADEAVTVNQMRRFLNAILNTRDYVRAITVITPGGYVVTCEHMTPATYKSSWLGGFSLSAEELYGQVIADYNTHIFSTEYGTNFDNRDYYLLHMAHRIIDYRRLHKECGIAILSLDEELLQKVCMNNEEDGRVFHFITDEKGRVISFGSDTEQLGRVVTDMEKEEDARKSDYSSFLKETGRFASGESGIYLYHDQELGWDIVNVTDLSEFLYSRKKQLSLILLLSGITALAVIIISTGMSKNLLSSIDQVIRGMRQAQDGDMSVRIEKDRKMTLEIESIADGFNDTLSRLNQSVERQREAQIMAMEAQINPHFLYNTLDTINWMAIDRDEYDISNAISALANILRYAIVNSNAEVSIEEEIDWLKKYIYLQQFRLKNRFSCQIVVEPDAKEARIHKLLLQPFVENAILHGFEKDQEDAELLIQVTRQGESLCIVIEDNGCGIDPETIEKINAGSYEKEGSRGGIGMRNALTRLNMYYGQQGRMTVASLSPRGTRAVVMIPCIQNPV